MTSATQVRNVVWRLFALVPDPDAAAQLSDFDRIERLLRPLGLFRKRARTIAAMSARYVAGGWGSVRELPGVGPYAADAWEIFVEGRWRTCAPQDKELRRYVEFMAETDGLGAGLERDPIPELSAGSSDAPGSDSPHWSDR
ncbi:unnamed protein product [Pedinophyceae sp. YPF-701]|nr:unnamed protein product [Pedinophyceae sp. YPF-701]